MLVAQSVQLFVTPWTVACQAPQSMECSRQEYWSELPFPFPDGLPYPEIEPGSPTLQTDSLLLSHQGSPIYCIAGCLYFLNPYELKTFLYCKACRDHRQFQELFTMTLFPEAVLLPVIVRPFFTPSEQIQGCQEEMWNKRETEDRKSRAKRAACLLCKSL